METLKNKSQFVILHEDCPDPVSNCDESDVYSGKLENVFFLGIPCQGGDYNSVEVSCRHASIAAASEAIIRLASAFNDFKTQSSHRMTD